MNYNPNIHHRKSIRLKGYDYSQAGLYFITICVKDRQCLFGDIIDGKMDLNDAGIMVRNEWLKIPGRFPYVKLHQYVVMPNHFHAIMEIVVGATLVVVHDNPVADDNKGQPQGLPPQNNMGDYKRAGASPAPMTIATVGEIIGAYKSLVANGCLKIYKSKNEMMRKLWQRNYHEHIIRNEQSYQTISDYIINNPAKWNDDKNFIS